MQLLSWMRACAEIAPVVLLTVIDSPVSEPSSVDIVVVISFTTRASAGTRSPTRTSMMSPGTSSAAAMSCCHAPSRKHRAFSGCSFCSASSADCADCSCHTPTTELITRIERMTAGSTQPLASPSIRASTYDSTATPSRICTSRSSNCAATSFQSGTAFSPSSTFAP